MPIITIKNSKSVYYLEFVDDMQIKSIKDSDGHSIDISSNLKPKFIKEVNKIYIKLTIQGRRRKFRVKQQDTKLVRPFIKENKIQQMRMMIKNLQAQLKNTTPSAPNSANANARIAAIQANANARVAAAQANANARVAAAEAATKNALNATRIAVQEPVVQNIANAATAVQKANVANVNALKAVAAANAVANVGATGANGANGATKAVNVGANGANGATKAVNVGANGANGATKAVNVGANGAKAVNVGANGANGAIFNVKKV